MSNIYHELPIYIAEIGDKLLIANGSEKLTLSRVKKRMYVEELDRCKHNVKQEDIEEWYSFAPGLRQEKVQTVVNKYYPKGMKTIRERYAQGLKILGFGLGNYVRNINVWDPEFLRNYPCKEQPKILIFDIEVASDGTIFPNQKVAEKPIITMGYKWQHEKEINIIEWDEKNQCDKKLVEKIINLISEADMIVTYNGLFFDVPYIINRARQHGLNLNILTKKEYRWIKEEFPEIRENIGLSHYDIFYTSINHAGVDRDMTLGNLKDRKMKTVAQFYGIDCIEMPPEKIGNIKRAWYEDKDEVIKYNISDVIATAGLFDIYYPKEQSLSRVANLAMNSIFERDNGTIITIMIQREMAKHKWLFNRTNEERYLMQNTNHYIIDNPSKKQYQGAVVDAMKRGIMHDTYKIDFSQQYPSTMRMFNISPDTILESYTESLYNEYGEEKDFHFERIDKTLKIGIPDTVVEKYFIIVIDLSKRGIVPKLADEFVAERKKYKDLMKKAKKENNIELEKYYDSMQQSYKVLSNTIYGILGNRKSKVGDIACALAVTGICRYITLKLIDKLHNILIEVDTDGYIISEDIDVESINKWIAEHFELITRDLIKKEDCLLILEKERIGTLYMHKQKTYIIVDDKGNIKKSGSAFKGTKTAKVVDRAIGFMINSIMIDKNYSFSQAKKDAYDIETLPIDYFVMREKVSKDKDAYKLSNNLEKVSLIDQFEEIYAREPEIRELISYVWVNREDISGVMIEESFHNLTPEEQRYTIDFKRYKKFIARKESILNYGAQEEVPRASTAISKLAALKRNN